MKGLRLTIFIVLVFIVGQNDINAKFTIIVYFMEASFIMARRLERLERPTDRPLAGKLSDIESNQTTTCGVLLFNFIQFSFEFFSIVATENTKR